MRKGTTPLFLFILFSSFLLAACDPVSFFYKQKNSKQIEDGSERTLDVIGANGNSILTPKERRALYVWILRDMQQEIFAAPFENSSELAQWLNVFEQGASFEGVYRGFILSKEYRRLESSGGRATKKARDFFAKELALLGTEKGESVDDRLKREIQFENLANNFTLFSLKRILTEKYLEKIDRIKNDREQFERFYLKTLKRFSKLKVDFGGEKRNSLDWKYHEGWAYQSTRGRLQWEILFRLHRILNEFGNLVVDREKK